MSSICVWMTLYNYMLCIYIYIYIYLDNPPVQNYRLKSETAIIIAGGLNFRRFQFFSLFQFPYFGLLCFFSPFRRVFSPFRWVFSPFQNRQTHAKWQKFKNCSEAEKNAASNNSWKGNNFAYIGRRRYIYIHDYMYVWYGYGSKLGSPGSRWLVITKQRLNWLVAHATETTWKIITRRNHLTHSLSKNVSLEQWQSHMLIPWLLTDDYRCQNRLFCPAG